MSLDVIWRAESGVELGAFHDNADTFISVVANLRERKYPTLGRIEEYGTSHIPATETIVQEVVRFRDQVSDPGKRGELSRLVGLLRCAASQRGSYLEFVGD